MFRTTVAILVFLAFIGSGLLHGVWANRWGSDSDVEAYAQRLQDVPMTVGAWDGRPEDVGELPYDLRGRTLGRTYVNRIDGRVVVVRLVCGPKGTMLFNHTPLECFPAAGFAMVGKPAKWSLPADADWGEFLTARFSKADSPVPQHLELRWSWSGDGTWRVPEYPRVAFARFPVLYKLYVACPLVTGGEPLDGDPSEDFLRALLPLLKAALFAAP
jgi:hypothetical protein